MNLDNFSEKRKFARLELRSNITFSLTETSSSENPSEIFRAVGKNIGAEGILFTADHELAPGTVIDLEIVLPNKPDPVYLNGTVKWCKPLKEQQNGKNMFDIGVKFSTIDRNHVIMLLQYVCGSLSNDIIKQLNKKIANE